MARKKRMKKQQSAMKNSVCKRSTCGGCAGCFYFLGFLGSAIYYISTATGFWVGVLGVVKSLVWPAFLVFEILKYVAA